MDKYYVIGVNSSTTKEVYDSAINNLKNFVCLCCDDGLFSGGVDVKEISKEDYDILNGDHLSKETYDLTTRLEHKWLTR